MSNNKNLLFVLYALFMPTFLWAGSTEEKARLIDLQQALEQHTSELKQKSNDVVLMEYKHNAAVESLSNSQEKYDESLQMFNQYAKTLEQQQAAEQDTTSAKRAVKRSEITLKMARRELSTRNNSVSRTSQKLNDLHTWLDGADATTSSLQEKIANQKTHIETVIKQEQAQSRRVLAEQKRKAEEASRLAATKREQEAARKEAERLARKQAAQKEEAERLARLEQQRIKQEQLRKEMEEKQRLAELEKARKAKELSPLDKEAKAYALKEMERLNEKLASGGMGKPLYKRVIMTVNGQNPLNYEFIGRKYYLLETSVQAGRQLFEINNFKFRRTIPQADDGEDYVFLFDTKKAERPRLVMFKKSLIAKKLN